MDRNDTMQIIVIVMDTVALRKESVDRNRGPRRSVHGPVRSLSARRAWIEIVGGAITAYPVLVALRKESVDRNLTGSAYSGPFGASLSARRAWIEIAPTGQRPYSGMSLSARRAWIEIPGSLLHM